MRAVPEPSSERPSDCLRDLAIFVARMASALAAGKLGPVLPRESLDALMTATGASGVALSTNGRNGARILLGRGRPIDRTPAALAARRVLETGTAPEIPLPRARSRLRERSGSRVLFLPIAGVEGDPARLPGAGLALCLEGDAVALRLAPGVEALALSIGSLAAALLGHALPPGGGHVPHVSAGQGGNAPEGPLAGIERLVGHSRGICDVRRLIVRFAPVDLPVLVTGESGTGKELVARALHEAGPRARSPFVSENCAAIPEPLFESLLFGHVRGAFTGAVRDHAGLLRQAGDGTIFLDEIGEMPPPLQAKMLRVIQEREIRPVGGTAVVPFEARIVAATNLDPSKLVASRRMRPDLFYRLQGITIELPPLRQRSEDLPILAGHFLSLAGRAAGKPGLRIEPDALAEMVAHDWPGNVRELSNTIERAVALSDGDTLDASLLCGLLRRREDVQGPAERPCAERRMIENALLRSRGCIAGAAAEIGWVRQKLYRRMRRLGIRVGFGRSGSVSGRVSLGADPGSAGPRGEDHSSSSSTFQ